MNAVISDRFIRLVSLSWLTGPIFDKELRVSSRRRRNYVLRFAYVIFFTLLTALIWEEEISRGSTSAWQVSRMAEVGLLITAFVVWFQFLASQVIAIVMLSTAISDEIYNKTLGLLMTTPVGSIQIVLGKLLSKLLQLVLLSAITLPLLAVIRVFGGVPWGYLVCGLCLTLTTVLFVGCLSLFFSIFTRRAHTVIIGTFVACAVLFALVPALALLTFHEVVREQKIINVCSYINPYLMLGEATDAAMSARGAGFAPWPVHCGVALGASVLLLLLAATFVRKVALRQATGQDILLLGRKKVGTLAGAPVGRRIRRVVGPPVFWKERRAPLLGKPGTGKIIGGILVLGLLLLTYGLCAREDILGSDEAQVTYMVIFSILGILFTIILPATCITSEKESRAWPILLTTTATNWEIIWGKFLGSMRRCSAAWLLLFAHVVVFTLPGIIHPVALLQLGILVGWIAFFLCATGLYFSTRFRRTTTAVVANVTLAAGLWALLPILLWLFLEVTRAGDDALEFYLDMNPVVHAIVISLATADGGLGNYEWIQGGVRDFDSAMGWILFNFVVYVGVGMAFLGRAWSRLRLNPV